MPERFTVSGRVLDNQGRPVAAVVRAFDRDLRSEQPLGETETNADGHFEIGYSAGQFRRAEKRSADLLVRLATRDGGPLVLERLELDGAGRDPTAPLFNAPPACELRLIVRPTDDAGDSEYERYLAAAEPLLEGLAWADLTREDLAFLAGDLELGEDAAHLEWLRSAARLSRQTGLPADAFYGWARLDLPEGWAELPRAEDEGRHAELLARLLARLIETPDLELADTLRRAVDAGIVPVSLLDRVDAAVAGLKRRGLLARPIVLRLLDEASNAPLAGLAVTLLDAEAGSADLGTDVADAAGRVGFTLYLPPGERQDGLERTVVLRVHQRGEAPPLELEQHLRLDGDEPAAVRLRLPELTAPTLAALREAGTLATPAALLERLAEREGVRTLADVRRRGGLRLENAEAEERAHLQELAALADLERLTPDLAAGAKLLRAGYSSVLEVARSPRAELVRKLADGEAGLGAAAVSRLHREALAQTAFLDQVLAGAAADQANGFTPLAGSLPGSFTSGGGAAPPGGTEPGLADLLQRGCRCEDCESAVSPAAYLAHLLDYAVRHVKLTTSAGAPEPIDLAELERRFHQPFGDLPTECEAVERRLRLARLGVEVLRAELGERPLHQPTREAALAAAEAAYRQAAYAALLAQFGTSYQELRRARGAAPEARRELASRLGLALTEPRPDPAATPGDELDQLLLDPDLPPADPRALTETALERLFGLADTVRNPLSEGVTLDDPGGQVVRWNLNGARWGHNTDAEGLVYLQVLKLAPDAFGVSAYADAGLTRLVAAGERATPAGPVRLAPLEGSGLSGTVELAYQADATARIAALPLLACWQQAGLRALWRQQDWPKDSALPGALGRVPLVDPDVVRPADLRSLRPDDPTLQIWQARDAWQAGRRAALAAERRQVRLAGGSRLEELDAALALGLPSGPDEPVGAARLLKLREREAEGHAIEADLARLGLAPSALTFLLRLREVVAADQRVADDEWEAVESTIVRAEQRRLAAAWREEERGLLTLSPDFFKLTDSVPAEPAGLSWLSTREARRDWQEVLAGRLEQERAVLTGLESTVAAAEEAALPALRDALVAAAEAEGETPDERAEWLSRRLLIDLLAGGCQTTTRLAQAIETVQGLLSGLRTGQFQQDVLPVFTELLSVRAAAVGERRIELFARGSDGVLWHRTWNGRWQGWRSRGPLPGRVGSGFAPSDPAVVARGPDRLDLVIRGSDRALWHRVYAGTWSAWWRLDGELEGNPALVARGPDRLEAFALRVPDLEVVRRAFDGAWSAWESIGTTSSRAPAAAAWGPARLDLVLALPQPELFRPLHRFWNGAWQDEPLDSELASEPVLASWGDGRLDLFQARNGHLWHKVWDGAWQPWVDLDPLVAHPEPLLETPPTACSRAAGTLDVFGLRHGRLWHRSFDGAAWSDWALVPDARLELVAEAFDDEWRWIGSYAAWRSAMFVLLYPENLLNPSLRPFKTPVFRQIVRETQNRRLTRDDACVLARRYAAYFRDVYRLQVQASCAALTVVPQGDPCSNPNPRARPLYYLFGLSPLSGRVYWSTVDAADESGYAQSFWKQVPLSDGDTPGRVKVRRIIGAIPAANQASDLHYLYLFLDAEEAGERRLRCVRFDLEKYDADDAWGAPADLADLPSYGSAPASMSRLNVLPVQVDQADALPRLAIHEFGYTASVYVRAVNRDGTGWAETSGDWATYEITPHAHQADLVLPQTVHTLEAVLHVAKVTWLVYQHQGRRRAYPSGGVALHLGNGPAEQFRGALPAYRPGSGESSIFVFADEDGQKVYREVLKSTGPASAFRTTTSLGSLARHAGNVAGPKLLVYTSTKDQEATYAFDYQQQGNQLVGTVKRSVVPRVFGWQDLPISLSSSELQSRRGAEAAAYKLNAGAPAAVLTYLEEAYCFVPLQLAARLQAAGELVAALDLYRTVYDYQAAPGERYVYHGLQFDAALPTQTVLQHASNWLLDPLNPHQVALTRRLALTRFVISSVARCLVELGDAEFTAEALGRARTAYVTALGLLDQPELKQELGGCAALVAQLKIAPGEHVPPLAAAAVGEIVDQLTASGVLASPNGWKYVESIKEVLNSGVAWAVALPKLKQTAQTALKAVPPPVSLAAALAGQPTSLARAHGELLTDPAVELGALKVGKLAQVLEADGVAAGGGAPGASPHNGPPVPATPLTASGSPAPIGLPPFTFCVPPNPSFKALRQRAELNLHKLRTCRNIAGIRREVDPYGAPTDAASGLPTVGAGGQLVVPTAGVIRPTVYRYAVLVERTRQLLQAAAQVEAGLLAALERRDEQAFQLLRARQEAGVAQAGVRLQALRLTEAGNEVALAKLQQDRAQLQADTFQAWLDAGLNAYEQTMLDGYGQIATLGALQATAEGQIRALQAATTAATASGPNAAGAAALASAVSLAVQGSAVLSAQAVQAERGVQVAALMASHERRMDEWRFQAALARQDVQIGLAQVALADDRVRIVEQERTIAEIQADNARNTVEFLTNKLTDVSFYDWMSDVLGDVYRFFLQQATAMARLAEQQLAFERQETPPGYIQADYWRTGADGDGGRGPDRRGLTGTARLLQDLTQLDQYAFTTNRRKLQISRTISLARLAPAELQRFRETGLLVFATPMELFDRDFPGHYLRLIRRVRTSVVALIPPTEGVRATLSNTGVSRVVVGPEVFQTVTIRRDPESLALSAPIDAGGVFELEPSSPELYLPFEGHGVDTTWELRLPKASNPFDFRTIADVLLTVDYTALQSYDYRQQVVQRLGTTVRADRLFSFRQHFPDAWYDLHNPDLVEPAQRMTVRIRTERPDFPANLDRLRIEHVVLYLARTAGLDEELEGVQVRFDEAGDRPPDGGSANTIGGVVSTRRGNGSAWRGIIGAQPFGEWELKLRSGDSTADRKVERWFRDEQIEDILLVVSYAGTAPPWPDS